MKQKRWDGRGFHPHPNRTAVYVLRDTLLSRDFCKRWCSGCCTTTTSQPRSPVCACVSAAVRCFRNPRNREGTNSFFSPIDEASPEKAELLHRTLMATMPSILHNGQAFLAVCSTGVAGTEGKTYKPETHNRQYNRTLNKPHRTKNGRTFSCGFHCLFFSTPCDVHAIAVCQDTPTHPGACPHTNPQPFSCINTSTRAKTDSTRNTELLPATPSGWRSEIRDSVLWCVIGRCVFVGGLLASVARSMFFG